MLKPAEFRAHPTPFVVAQSKGLYRAIAVHVHDGDTFTAFLDLGFYTYTYQDIRVLGVDAYEVVGAERALGLQAKQLAEAWMLDRPLLIQTVISGAGAERKSFDRFLGAVWCDPTATGGGMLFAPLLIAQGLGIQA